jgi:hypothetical protein
VTCLIVFCHELFNNPDRIVDPRSRNYQALASLPIAFRLPT